MSTILKAENISKQYCQGTLGSGTLSHDLSCWFASLRGKEDPYLQADTAAGHAICNAFGLKVMQTDTDNELQTNKAQLLNPYFIVRKFRLF